MLVFKHRLLFTIYNIKRKTTEKREEMSLSNCQLEQHLIVISTVTQIFKRYNKAQDGRLTKEETMQFVRDS